MHIGILTVHIDLPGCRSLKEKRQRMGGLHERFSLNPAVAVCESGEHDRLDARVVLRGGGARGAESGRDHPRTTLTTGRKESLA